MQNLIYSVFHNHALKRGEPADLWGTALAALNTDRYPNFDRLRNVVTILSHNLKQDEQTEQ